MDGAACVAIERNVVLANLSRGIAHAFRPQVGGNVEKNKISSEMLPPAWRFQVNSSIHRFAFSTTTFVNNRFGLVAPAVRKSVFLQNDFSRAVARGVADGDFTQRTSVGLLEFAASTNLVNSRSGATVPTAQGPTSPSFPQSIFPLLRRPEVEPEFMVFSSSSSFLFLPTFLLAYWTRPSLYKALPNHI